MACLSSGLSSMYFLRKMADALKSGGTAWNIGIFPGGGACRLRRPSGLGGGLNVVVDPLELVVGPDIVVVLAPATVVELFWTLLLCTAFYSETMMCIK